MALTTLILLIFYTPDLFADANRFIQIAEGQNEVLTVNAIERVAVGNAKVLKVKSISNKQLLLTGKKEGKTRLQVWRVGKVVPDVYDVQVVSPGLFERRWKGNPLGVHIQLKFLELNRAHSRKIGLRLPDTVQGSGQASWSSEGGLKYSASAIPTPIFLKLLQKKGWARILAEPDLYVRLGELAHFHSGGELPVMTSRGGNGQFYKHVSWKPYGLTVKIRPDSADGVHLQSDVWVEVSELDSSIAVDGVPALTRRHVETKLDSLDGETLLISGLVRQTRSKGSTGTPFLSDIPILGLLFSEKEQRNEQTEIWIALRLSFTSRARRENDVRQWKKRWDGSS